MAHMMKMFKIGWLNVAEYENQYQLVVGSQRDTKGTSSCPFPGSSRLLRRMLSLNCCSGQRQPMRLGCHWPRFANFGMALGRR